MAFSPSPEAILKGSERHTLWPFLAFLLLLTACQSRPIEELSLADVALKAAQKAKADAFAPDSYRRAENQLLRAKRDFAEGYFDSCRKFATQARLAAEKAEFQSLKKQRQSKAGPTLSPEEAGPSGPTPGPSPEIGP